ncbi:MAG TPA: SUMF1/EgtB/PvdO family nonheme iron enzyme [Anaerolineae bacterium]
MSTLEFVTLDTSSTHGRIAAHPVSLAEYRQYLLAAGQPAPAGLDRIRDPHSPVVYVSQVAAREYCRWLGSQDRQAYRLPTVAELLQLAGAEGEGGVGEDLWPHTANERPEVMGARHGVYLCEWTCEFETLPNLSGGEPRILGSVFYPPWLREGNNPKQVQGMMLAGQGFSFVGFRVAYDSATDRP